MYVKTRDARAVVAPTTIAPDPTRTHRKENKESPIHSLYAYIYVADREEGLILINVATLLDGDPTNNFLRRDVTFNPNGILKGATNITIAGTYAYVCCDAGLVVVSLANPKYPQIATVIGGPHLVHPHAVAIQFRYAFVVDKEGLKVLDVTNLSRPQVRAKLALSHAHNLYVARTYAYISGGPRGLIIVDVKNPERPRIDQVYDANGQINDLHDVKLGIAYNSQFAYLADGKNGLRVVQLTNSETPGVNGFSPRPTPQLIATFKLPKDGHAHFVAEGVDRDRAVDESGNQIAVFGRIGARPLNLQEQRQLFLKNGRLFRVTDDPRWPGYVPTRPAFRRSFRSR